MPQWGKYAEYWEIWVEDLSGGKVLRAYRHPVEFDYDACNIVHMPGGWVYVYNSFRSAIDKGAPLEEIRLECSCGWLEIECIIHEMRAKYGGLPYVVD
jgi:hypothetical protein